MRRWQTILVVSSVGLSLGCASLSSKQASGISSLMQGNPPQIRERLLSQIPLGTPRAEAMRIALSLGLEPASEPDLGLQEDNSLRFRNDGKQWWGGHRISLIQIECPHGAVEDIFCEQIGVGW